VILLDNLVSRLVFKNLEAAVFRCGLMTLDTSQKRSERRNSSIWNKEDDLLKAGAALSKILTNELYLKKHEEEVFG
jgi:hypothetical protein